MWGEATTSVPLSPTPPCRDLQIDFFFPITLHYRKRARRKVPIGVRSVFPNNGNPVDYRRCF